MRIVVVLLVVFLVLAQTGLALSNKPFTQEEKGKNRAFLASQLALDALKSKSAAERAEQLNLALISTLKLDKLDLNDNQKKDLCSLIDTSASTLKQLHDNVIASVPLKCGATFANAEQVVKKSLEAATVEDVYYAARIVNFQKNQIAVAKSVQDLKAAFDRLAAKLDENTGLFGSVRDTGLSYETLVTLYSLLTALPDYKDGDKLLSTLVKVARNGDKVVKKISSSLPLRDNVALIRGLNRLAGIVPQKKITKDDVLSVANALLSKKQHDNNLATLSELAEGLSSFSNLPTPVIVSDVSKTSNNGYQVQVSDVFGNKFADKISVSFNKVYNVRNSDNSVADNVSLEAIDDTTYVWKNPSEGMKSAGVFNFDVTITPEKPKANFAATTVTRSFMSESSATVSDVILTLYGKDEKSFTAKYPNKFQPATVTLDNAASRKIGFSALVSGSPHQVFIRLYNKDKKREAVFALKEQDKDHRIDINFDKLVGETFGYTSGLYTVQLLVGDVTMKTPVQWEVGTLDLQFPAAKRTDKDEEAEQYALRPEIQHQFRAPAKRAPDSIATVFTALSVAPLGIFLLLVLARVGFNFAYYPSGLDSILALVFHGLVFAMLAVIFLYWVQFTIFQALSYLLVLGAAATLIGSRVLSAVVSKRIAGK